MIPTHVLVDEVDDILGGCAWEKDFGDSLRLQVADVFLRNNSSDHDQRVIHAILSQQIYDTRAEGVVGTR